MAVPHGCQDGYYDGHYDLAAFVGHFNATFPF